jgi:hypothetical protein
MGFRWLLNPRLIALTTALLGFVGCVWYAHSTGHRAGAREVQARWTQEQLLTAQATAKMLAEARQKEQALQDQIHTIRQRAKNEATRIAADHAAVVDSLRNRPDARAPSGVPEGAVAGVGCTGAGLSFRDAEFLAGLAADAARTQAALKQCVDAYEAVRLGAELAADSRVSMQPTHKIRP